MRTSWGSATDRGVRRYNEDSLLAYPPVFLVADGMGGHDAGDVASRVAVEEFAQLAGRASVGADDVHACVHRAARRLREVVHPGLTAGTTVAGVAVATHQGGTSWLVFNIGDSRVYRWVSGVLQQISVDHSVVQELVDRGLIHPDEAGDHPDRHVITRAIGTGLDPEPDYWLLPVGPTDRMVVCTDGLTSVLTDDDVAAVIGRLGDPQEAAEQLVAAALAAGALDNISVVVVDVATTGHTEVAETTAGGARRTVVLAEERLAEHEAWVEEVHGATSPRPSRSRVPEVDR